MLSELPTISSLLLITGKASMSRRQFRITEEEELSITKDQAIQMAFKKALRGVWFSAYSKGLDSGNAGGERFVADEKESVND
jgi:hypothetical protein